MDAKCPAAEIVYPVLSPNVSDVECRIAGRLQPTVGSDGKPAVCCALYTKCAIWRQHKNTIHRDRSIRVDEMQRRRAPHTLSGKGHERESVQI